MISEKNLDFGYYILKNGSAFVSNGITYKIGYSQGLPGETNIDLLQLGVEKGLSIGGVIRSNGHVALTSVFCHIDHVLPDDEAAKITMPY